MNRLELIDLTPQAKLEPEAFIGRVASSLELLRAVYMDPGQPLTVWLRAALGAIPFEHPRLTLTAQLNGTADRMEAALKAAQHLRA